MVLATPQRPGAVAIVQLHGDVVTPLQALTKRHQWPVGRSRLVSVAEIDDAIVWRPTAESAQIMPHGGERVVRRILLYLREIGVALADTDELDPSTLFPEAADRFEALALAAIAGAASPLATNLLLAQPPRWRARPTLGEADEARSRRLNRLLTPPTVVLAGPPNVGKSTLTNALAGRRVSIAMDQPGTTTDYTAGRIQLCGLVVDWHDTPGLREPASMTERRANQLAHDLMRSADLLVAMTDKDHDWPTLPRAVDVRVGSKADLGARTDSDLSVSSTTGEGLAGLVRHIREALVPAADLDDGGPWRFDRRLNG